MRMGEEMVKGYLHVMTTPVSGDIFVNNEYRGTTDLNIELDPGTYTVSFGNVVGYITPSIFNTKVDSGLVTLITAEYFKI